MTQSRKLRPTRAKARPASRPAKARPASVALAPLPPAQVVPEHDAHTSLVLGEDANIGALGLMELRLNEAEEAVLSRPVDVNQVLVKPTGEAYLSHPSYTRWFNEAFGRLGWSLRPVSKPVMKDGLVVVPYVLYIHGHPVAYALGEQEYSPTNARQSYGDAIESTVASGLRRCAKRLGVGLELWEKRWLHKFESELVLKVKVVVKKHGEEKEEYWFRRRDDPPFWQEQKAQRTTYGQRSSTPAPMDRPRNAAELLQEIANKPRASQHPHESSRITDPQRKRLFTIAKHHNRTEAEVKDYLKRKFNIASTHDLTRRDYDTVISALEASGPLGGTPAPPPVPLVGEVLTEADIDFDGTRDR